MATNPNKVAKTVKLDDTQFNTIIDGGSVPIGEDTYTADENTMYLTPEIVYETYSVSSWTALSSSEPYLFSATVTATHTISNDTEVELINDQAVLFGNYGFAIGAVSGQVVTIYAIAQPTSSVSLTIGYRG